MKAILGLGNPGLKYSLNRHNLGFLAVKELARKKRIRLNKKSAHCVLGQGVIDSQRVILGLPSTFMNLSGQAARELVAQKRIQPKQLLVICDDANLPLGKIRLRPRGSDGGHKGLRSIIQTLEENSFPRLRIGVGRGAAGGRELSGYVLANFSRSELKSVKLSIARALECAQAWIEHGVHYAMNAYN